jgi:hypothetical protein
MKGPYKHWCPICQREFLSEDMHGNGMCFDCGFGHMSHSPGLVPLLSHRDLDWLIAKHIFGKPDSLKEVYDEIPAYSTDIKDSWEVAEKMIGDQKDPMIFLIDIHPHRILNWDVNFTSVFMGGGHGYANAKTASLAICLASLRVKGIEI